MSKNALLSAAFFFLWLSIVGQDKIEFGKLSPQEKTFSVYENDTTATAIYLYENGDNYFEVRDNYIWLIKKYHAKIKILDKKGFDYANISIPYYRSEKRAEKVNKIRAITHNGTTKRSIKKEEIFDVNTSERWSEKRFTFPDIKEGAILEYAYEVQSPFHFNLTGWEFQADIPKVYTEYNAKIPGNWSYNRSLMGEIELNVNDASIQTSCFSVPGISAMADCEVLKYAMKDVPAFKDSESFMLSSSNYLSKLEFELSEYNSFYGDREKFTKSWEDVDQEFKSDRDIGRQLHKKGFFEKNVPLDLLTEGEPFNRAKNIYDFVKNHYTWDKEFGLWKNNRVKDAFDKKLGNASEINMTLINLLNSAGLKADMVLLATRKRGLPKKTHPVMTDFNYVVAKVDIDDKSYLLDATNKNAPFGMLPFRCLNYIGRVMDFKKDSYWYDIVPEAKNKQAIRAQLKINSENGKIEGLFDFINSGYFSMAQRNILHANTEDVYLESIEEEANADLSINAYELKEKYSNEKKLVERFEFEIEQSFENDYLYVNPFFMTFFDSNPFTSNTRNYPIDFGYNRNYNFSAIVTIPEGYKVKTIPEAKNYTLLNNGGNLRFQIRENSVGSLDVLFDFKLNRTQYNSANYEFIKDFFAKAVQLQTQSLIVLEKT